MKEIKTKVAIVGGGPAGCAAAIQLKRAGIDSVIFEKNEIGGLVVNANYIENYLGLPRGIEGIKFCELLKEHVNSMLIEIINEEINETNFIDGKFHLESKQSKCISDFLILATGTKPKKIMVKGSDILEEKNLLFFEPKDLPKDKNTNLQIAILGGGDAAFDYALNLVQKENKITIIHRTEFFSCLELLYYRASNIEDILIKDSITIKEFQITNNNKAKIIVEEEEPIVFDLIICAYGREPNDNLLNKFSKELIDSGLLYPIGDLTNRNYRQVSIASADGIQSAMEIEQLLRKRK